MADRIRLGRFVKKRFEPILDLNDLTVYAFVKDTLNFVLGEARQNVASTERRYGGGQVVSEVHDNGRLEAEWYVGGSTKDEALANADKLAAAMASTQPGLYVEDRPEGASKSVYYELRGPGGPQFVRSWSRWSSTGKLHLRMVAPTAPIPVGDYMDIVETFEPQGEAEYVNWVSNPNFEVDTGGWAAFATSGTPAVTRVAGDSPIGGAVGNLTVTTTGTGHTLLLYRNVDGLDAEVGPGYPRQVKPGDTVWVQGRVKTAAGTFQDIGVEVRWFDRAGNFLSEATIVPQQNNPTPSTWYHVQGPAVAPADAYYMGFGFIGHAGAAGTYSLRGTMAAITVGTGTPLWFDGNYGLAADKAVGWQGMPLRSPSIQYKRSPLDDYSRGGPVDGSVVTGGVLKPRNVAGTNYTATGRGYQFRDGMAILQFVTPSSFPTDFWAGIDLRFREDSSGLRVTSYRSVAGASQIAFYRVNEGAMNYIGGVDFGAAADHVASTRYWLVVYLYGTSLRVEHWTVPPTPRGTAALEYEDHATLVNEVLMRPTGYAGWYFQPGHDSARIEHFEAKPYTWKGRAVPAAFDLEDIPGTAPAEADIEVTELPPAAQAWGAIGWSKAPAVRNLVQNGDFEVTDSGWATNVFYTNSVTSFARVVGSGGTDTPQSGTAFGRMVTPGSVTNEGIEYRMFGNFRAGETYTLSFWARSWTGGLTPMQAFLGTQAEIGTVVSIGGVPTVWTQYTTTLTLPQDRQVLHAVLRVNGTDAGTTDFDNVQVYRGTTPPTLPTQTGGRGSHSPIGVIEAETAVPFFTSGFALTADGSRSASFVMQWTTSGAGSASMTWYVDGSLIDPDDFTMGDLSVEVWAWVKLASTLASPQLALTAKTDVSGGPVRETREPTVVRTKPSSGTLWRMARLGTINLGSTQGTRWLLTLTATVSSGSSGVLSVDQLLLLPAQRRLAGATGKALDATYPMFLPSTSETTRTVRHDGTSELALPNRTGFPAPALGGALPEFGPGDVTLVVATSNRVPDDPTVDANEAGFGYIAQVHASVRPRYFGGRGDL